MNKQEIKSYEDEVAAIFKNKQMKKPSVIVFDLDYTIWPFFIENKSTPFRVVNSSNKIKFYDGDNKEISYFEEIPKLLTYLKKVCDETGIKLAIASRSGGRKIALEFLK